jgi:hypothetical protein
VDDRGAETVGGREAVAVTVDRGGIVAGRLHGVRTAADELPV